MSSKSENLGPIASMFKKGLMAFFEGQKKDVRTKGGFRAWVTEPASGAIKAALADQEIQELGSNYVKDSLNDTLSGVKSDFPNLLNVADENLKTSDTRNNYQKIKSLIGGENDRWCVGLGKSVLARVISWGVPVVSYISAGIAAKITENSQLMTPESRGKFNNIFGKLLSIISPPKSPARIS